MRLDWAQQLKRVFGIDIEKCEHCAGPVRIVSCIEDAEVGCDRTRRQTDCAAYPDCGDCRLAQRRSLQRYQSYRVEAARGVIANAEGVWFSEASIWDLGLKWRKGKIAVQPRRLLDRAFADGLRPLPIQLVSPRNMGMSHEKN